MNMNNAPTKDELKELIRVCDDSAGGHILWVNKNGEVQISLLTDETPAGWAKRMEKSIQFRYESYGANKDYVGENAANDDDYVSTVFNELLKDWEISESHKGGVSLDGTSKILGNILTIDLEKRQVAGQYLDDVIDNTFRVYNLLSLYNSLKQDDEFSTLSATDDILRLSVVFIHSTLEEFLRRLAIDLLPNAEEKVLNSIPLASGTGRADKFSLGSLAKFKEKTVEEVIKESVESYYERSNFNNTDDIAILFRELGLDVKKFNTCFSELNKLMSRRHYIVHRGDKMRKPHESLVPVSAISAAEVTEWLNVVTEFCGDVFEDVVDKNLLP